MAVVGGGVIGCEYACMFAALGIEVKLIEGRETLLPFLDGEFSALLRERVESLGVEMLLPDAVDSVQSGPEHLTMNLKSGRHLQVETILVASGRSGNTQDLHLEPLGIKAAPQTSRVSQITYQTAVPHTTPPGT
jgi:NAD(P) transhydrogenase